MDNISVVSRILWLFHYKVRQTNRQNARKLENVARVVLETV